ncbi:MAG TPA: tRNA pseudouridine(55) synthase TruB [Candidatus Saccharimonas sp.]|nr:tRNA pseudouridine(55) synthase TruB [Candidatus Saccharimonas sp.]
MDGLLLVNKPLGMTSFDVIRRLRRQTGVRKIGHAGTLDPMASGLMLMLFGTACKQAQSYSKLDKRYVGEVTLGRTSSTGDREGELTPVSERVPDAEEVAAALVKLTGQITQTPPAYSAIKINGREAYKRVRAGETVVMPSRTVTVYENQLLRYDYPVLELDSRVSSGTYIRTLAEDLGQLLGTGAYLSGLVRTEVGDYTLDEAVVLDEADAAMVAQHLR